MRVLVVVLLIGIAGCGGGSSPPAQTANANPVAALEKIGATIKRNEQGEVVEVNLRGTKVTDAGLVHLKGLTNLQTLYLDGIIATTEGAGPPIFRPGFLQAWHTPFRIGGNPSRRN